MTNYKIVPIEVIILEKEKAKQRSESNQLQLELPLPRYPFPTHQNPESHSDVTIVQIENNDEITLDDCVILSLI